MDINNRKVSGKQVKDFYGKTVGAERRKRIKDPDGYGKRTGVCGDTVEIFITTENNRIDKIFFETNGCFNTSACANTLGCLAEGKAITDAWDITPEHIINYLQSLPSEEVHCAELVAGTFYLALSDYMHNQRSPWKKIYQTQNI